MAVKNLKDVKDNLLAPFSILKSKINASKGTEELAIKKAQIAHAKKYGREMSPSKLKDSVDGIVMDKESKDYLGTKNKILKGLKQRTNFSME